MSYCLASFISTWSTPFSIYCKVSLPVKNFLSFYFSGNVLISPSFLKYSFAGYRIIGWQLSWFRWDRNQPFPDKPECHKQVPLFSFCLKEEPGIGWLLPLHTVLHGEGWDTSEQKHHKISYCCEHDSSLIELLLGCCGPCLVFAAPTELFQSICCC